MSGITQALLACFGGNGGAGLSALSVGFLDGSEHVTRADDKWKNATHATAPASGITGMNGKCYDDATWGQKIITVPETGEFTATFKFRYRVAGNEAFCGFVNGASVHLQLEMNADGTIDVTGPGGFGTHTTTDTIAIDTTVTIEFYGKIDASAGAYRLKINGVVANKAGGGTMDQSGLDTQNGATTTINRWRLGGLNLDSYTDDHALDIVGNAIGPGQVETLYPDGAGDLTEMTPNAGSNWSQCDEATHDGDTSYVSNAASAKRDCYTFQNRSVVGTPRAVQVATTVKFTSGTPTFKNFLRIGGANHDGAITHTATSGYKTYVEVWSVNPATSLPWTDSDINSLQAGISAIDANLRMTQVVIEVWVTT